MWLSAVSVAVVGLWMGSPPRVDLVARGSIPGDRADVSGLTDRLSEGTPHNRLGSFGSAIAYTGRGHRYIALNDRGPADGASAFRARFQTLEIRVDPRSGRVEVHLEATTLLSGMDGQTLVGSIVPREAGSLRYDPEGVCLSPRGTLWISEEYGPSIDEFGMDGRMLRRLTIPDAYVGRVAGQPEDERPPRVKSGRYPNRGFEGLTITEDGERVVAIAQGPLIQDGAWDEQGRSTGRDLRLVEVHTSTGKMREFVYRMEAPEMGVSEILSIGGSRFLVLERDGLAGELARARGIWEIDTAGATDVSGEHTIATMSGSLQPVSKRKVIDLMEPRFGIAGPGMPEKFEGLTFGPTLADGRRLLLVTVDNDMKAEVGNDVFAFALPGPSALKADADTNGASGAAD